jgi:phosphoglucosamine mutase
MAALFGTDGIRGRALVPPLDEGTVRRLGVALAEELGQCGEILMAGDTRASTPLLARWLGEGLQASGVEVRWGGVLPTPAVSHLVRHGSFAAGVVISASHNPAHDNGIKVLDQSGEKITDASERRLEELVARVNPRSGPELPEVDRSLTQRYIDLVLRSHQKQRPLEGLEIVVDAAHGAASDIAEVVLARLGASVSSIASSPDGANINRECGATAPQRLAVEVLRQRAHCGLALDGDADRAVIVDESGRVLDGDDILLAWARCLSRSGTLPGARVVATVMSNFGLERALARDGVTTVRCPVGDRAVWLAMQEHGAVLGGEQSGHVICSHLSVTGDGLLTGSHVLAIAAASDRPMSALSDLERLPQVLINVPVREKRPFEAVPQVIRELEGTERVLCGRGRVLLRYSGTEDLARVMVEGTDPAEIRHLASQLAETIRQQLQ